LQPCCMDDGVARSTPNSHSDAVPFMPDENNERKRVENAIPNTYCHYFRKLL
jgi:hypothetical protein